MRHFCTSPHTGTGAAIAEFPASMDRFDSDLIGFELIDQYSGKPLLYGLADGQPLIWSTGPDRVDDRASERVQSEMWNFPLTALGEMDEVERAEIRGRHCLLWRSIGCCLLVLSWLESKDAIVGGLFQKKVTKGSLEVEEPSPQPSPALGGRGSRKEQEGAGGGRRGRERGPEDWELVAAGGLVGLYRDLVSGGTGVTLGRRGIMNASVRDGVGGWWGAGRWRGRGFRCRGGRSRWRSIRRGGTRGLRRRGRSMRARRCCGCLGEYERAEAGCDILPCQQRGGAGDPAEEYGGRPR
jgi:hypothetical protein